MPVASAAASIDPIVCVCGADMTQQTFSVWNARTQSIMRIAGIWSCPTPRCLGNQQEQHSKRIDRELAEIRKAVGRR